jgi:hypothetical protein
VFTLVHDADNLEGTGAEQILPAPGTGVFGIPPTHLLAGLE